MKQLEQDVERLRALVRKLVTRLGGQAQLTLTPLARRLLIMADGEQNVAQLAAALARPADDSEIVETLATLVRNQYLHPRDDDTGTRDPQGVQPPGAPA